MDERGACCLWPDDISCCRSASFTIVLRPHEDRRIALVRVNPTKSVWKFEVVYVPPGEAAYRAGLRKGDFITEHFTYFADLSSCKGNWNIRKMTSDKMKLGLQDVGSVVFVDGKKGSTLLEGWQKWCSRRRREAANARPRQTPYLQTRISEDARISLYKEFSRKLLDHDAENPTPSTALPVEDAQSKRDAASALKEFNNASPLPNTYYRKIDRQKNKKRKVGSSGNESKKQKVGEVLDALAQQQTSEQGEGIRRSSTEVNYSISRHKPAEVIPAPSSATPFTSPAKMRPGALSNVHEAVDTIQEDAPTSNEVETMPHSAQAAEVEPIPSPASHLISPTQLRTGGDADWEVQDNDPTNSEVDTSRGRTEEAEATQLPSPAQLTPVVLHTNSPRSQPVRTPSAAVKAAKGAILQAAASNAVEQSENWIKNISDLLRVSLEESSRKLKDIVKLLPKADQSSANAAVVSLVEVLMLFPPIEPTASSTSDRVEQLAVYNAEFEKSEEVAEKNPDSKDLWRDAILKGLNVIVKSEHPWRDLRGKRQNWEPNSDTDTRAEQLHGLLEKQAERLHEDKNKCAKSIMDKNDEELALKGQIQELVSDRYSVFRGKSADEFWDSFSQDEGYKSLSEKKDRCVQDGLQNQVALLAAKRVHTVWISLANLVEEAKLQCGKRNQSKLEKLNEEAEQLECEVTYTFKKYGYRLINAATKYFVRNIEQQEKILGELVKLPDAGEGIIKMDRTRFNESLAELRKESEEIAGRLRSLWEDQLQPLDQHIRDLVPFSDLKKELHGEFADRTGGIPSDLQKLFKSTTATDQSSNDEIEAAGQNSNDGNEATGQNSNDGNETTGQISNDGNEATSKASNDGNEASDQGSNGENEAAGQNSHEKVATGQGPYGENEATGEGSNDGNEATSQSRNGDKSGCPVM